MKMYSTRWIAVLAFFLCGSAAFAQTQPVDLQLPVASPFRFVAYGDTRFTDSSDRGASNPGVRRALVQAIDDARPAFVSIGGDIAYRGDDPKDWQTWDAETSIWREHHIPVYPALGNHDLHGDLKVALANYFLRFPELHESRYYAVRAANALMLILDSSLDEVAGAQGDWLAQELDRIPHDVNFVILVFHHPPYTSSSDAKTYGGGHSARAPEQALAKMIEDRQQQQRATARFVVFSGHVHNYERHEHNGVVYFVTGGGGAHAYPIDRAPGDPYPDHRINYHYLLVNVDHSKMTVTMNRLELVDGKSSWTQPDAVTIAIPAKQVAEVHSSVR
jgi:Icc-related predicted phosphoesterase